MEKVSCLLMYVCFFVGISLAQQQKFEGSFEAYQGLIGKAEFDFIRRNNVTIKNGNYTFFLGSTSFCVGSMSKQTINSPEITLHSGEL